MGEKFNPRLGLGGCAQNPAAGGGASPTKMTTPSPPGLLVLSTKKSGFQLLIVQTLPALSIWDAVWRIIGEKLGGSSGQYSGLPFASSTSLPAEGIV